MLLTFMGHQESILQIESRNNKQIKFSKKTTCNIRLLKKLLNNA